MNSYAYVRSPIERPRIHYRLQVCQQPIRARMCGFGEKDRRPIDPPPVVQLIMTTPEGKPLPLSSVDPAGFVVHADLWCTRRAEERSLVINPSSLPTPNSGPRSSVLTLHAPSCTRNLMGSTTANSSVIRNHNEQPGIYFIFQDLSVRTEGTFTLRFSFVDLTNVLFGCFGENRSIVLAEAYTEPFKVYSAKRFPGMTESTALSAAFSKQGIKIPIRTKKRHRKDEATSGNHAKDHQVYMSPSKLSSIAAISSTSSGSEKSLSDEGSDKRFLYELCDSEMHSNDGKYTSTMADPNLSKRRRKESIEEEV